MKKTKKQNPEITAMRKIVADFDLSVDGAERAIGNAVFKEMMMIDDKDFETDIYSFLAHLEVAIDTLRNRLFE